MTDTVSVGRIESERGVEDGQQRGTQAGRDRTRRRQGNAGGNGDDEVQELGGDAELHESDQVGRAIHQERDMNEDGEPETRKLEKWKKARRCLKGVEKVTRVIRAWNHDGMTVDVHDGTAGGRESLDTGAGAHDWREDVSSQTVVECWRRGRQRARALVGWKCWLHHPERLTDSDSDAHLLRES